MGCLSLPLLQRFPAQHMESRAQRFRLLRQGRQAPRASLQNSSPPQSSSSVQTPDCYNSIKEKAACHWTIKILLVKLTWTHLLPWRTELTFTHGNYLQGVCGLVSHATGGRGARTRTDGVGAFATKNPGQVFDGVGVHQDCPRVNVPKVSKEREIHSKEATRRRYLHDSPFKLCCVDNTQKKNPLCLATKVTWVTKSKAALNPWIPKFPESFEHGAFEASWLPVLGWSLYTCGPVCLPAPRYAQQRRRGGISKRAPLYGNGRLFSLHRTAFHNVCVMIMTCKVCLNGHHSVTHTGNYTQSEDLLNP